ncbi:hypothetical protein BDP55DRAFT_654634 [Colletotrichum godetiae]|uniref:Uncharacterized protein n=1 Tax=Colletotrichum godetiae TaxID=1209918 RepID=A0AAJ0AUI8_9PEZI|nr:uncharacterized protein BDP55DRAFT_654634 [Colletotrichum godetiae]KAK1689221.1 hypothetical protein BDP55DRAFT_654634 [Colletotrichum godetiae]
MRVPFPALPLTLGTLLMNTSQNQATTAGQEATQDERKVLFVFLPWITNDFNNSELAIATGDTRQLKVPARRNLARRGSLWKGCL